MPTYTLIPTFPTSEDPEGFSHDHSQSWILDAAAGFDIQNAVIRTCREIEATGATVYNGPHGAILGPEGYEDNYCGWIDARENPVPVGPALSQAEIDRELTLAEAAHYKQPD
jgi:hypothetical protein